MPKTAPTLSPLMPRWLFPLLLLLTSVAVFVPLLPRMPGADLDPSWAFGMNQAVAQGLVFGRDIMFTFGPYAAIYTRAYHPATDGLMLWGSLYLAMSFCLAAWLSFRDSRPLTQFLLLLALAAAIHTHDALLWYSRNTLLLFPYDALMFYYPLLVGTFVLKTADASSTPCAFTCQPWRHVILLLLALPLGLLPLIKGSAIIGCSAILMLACLFLASKRDWTGAALLCLAPLLSLAGFWVAAGQPLAALPNYFASMGPIVSGYTEAMSLDGRPSEVLLYIAVSLLLLATVALRWRAPALTRLLALAMLACTLFLAFKAGFVRHDSHAVTAGTMILFVALLTSAAFMNGRGYAGLIAAALLWLTIDARHIPDNPANLLRNTAATYASAWNGLTTRLSSQQTLEKDFQRHAATLREALPIPPMAGTTDIYSYDQAYLLASDNTWNPRPVPQSYSVYTPTLVQANKDHLQGPGRPDNLILRIQPIDRRFPSLDDGASWPVILNGYRPSAQRNGYLFLTRIEPSQPERHQALSAGQYRFGEAIDLPSTSDLLFVQIDIRPTLWGRLASTLFKPGHLELDVTLEDGSSRQYRIVSGMAKTGFLLSPIVESTEDFARLYTGSPHKVDTAVRRIAVSAGQAWAWQAPFDATFMAIAAPGTAGASVLATDPHPATP